MNRYWLERLSQQAAERERLGLSRARRVIAPIANADGRPLVRWQGQRLVNFSSNDYLGLAHSPELANAFTASGQAFSGSAASPLVTGHQPIHQALEAELCRFTGQAAACLFCSGYQANLAVGQALIERGERVMVDRLNHASLNDGLRLAGARIQRYAHADLADAQRRWHSDTVLLVSDSLFSMDGDLAPLTGLTDLCRGQKTALWIDDAHAFGVLGPGGRGALAAAGLPADSADIYVATFGKAMGLSGAFVAGHPALIERLENSARGLIYSTALPPPLAEAALAALALIQSGDALRARLQRNIGLWQTTCHQHALAIPRRDSPIQVVPVGDNAQALALADALLARGFLVTAIRPPTVPAGTARLRVTLSAAHSPNDILGLVKALAECGRRLENPTCFPATAT
ncbi:MAG: 8-amino-7-oxononanoate synthase [Wenzhouxiangella sp.]